MRRSRLSKMLPAPGPLLLALTTLLGVSACAGFGRGGAPEPEEPIVGWNVKAEEYIALWYHALAFPDAAVPPAEQLPLPRFDPGYTQRMREIAEREGKYPRAIVDRAAEFGRIFETSGSYEGLEFLPLYFRSAEALYSGIDLWNQAGGNPRNTPVADAVRVIAFLSSLFPRPAERQNVVEWARLVREEENEFYRTHWLAISTPLASRVAEVRSEWERIEPEIRNYLNYIGYRNGEIYLVPALGAEGRSVTGEMASVRIAVHSPPPGRPEEALWSVIHELLYPLVDDIVREFVAPARIREIGEARLNSIAAVRGGAILLDGTLPGRAEGYRRFFLSAAEGTGDHEAARLSGLTLQRAFEEAFPIPAEMVRGLEETVELALAGI